MTPNQINAACAECLGKLVPEVQRAESLWPDVEIAKAHNTHCLPDYFNDWNTRPEMLKALSEAQERELIQLLWRKMRDERFLSEGLSEYMDKMPVIILRLSQPQFAELFLRVKGRWVEKEGTEE